VNREIFNQALRRIYAAHGKIAPANPDILAAIWKRVEDLPDAFMAYAETRFADYEKLPGNMGRELKCDLWPEFRGQNPELVTRREERCDLCRNSDFAGMFRAYRDDEVRMLFCCSDYAQKNSLRRYTRFEALNEGYALEPQVSDDVRAEIRDAMERRLMDKRFADMGVGNNQPPRKEHADYIARGAA
jgi:hypothetical protein